MAIDALALDQIDDEVEGAANLAIEATGRGRAQLLDEGGEAVLQRAADDAGAAGRRPSPGLVRIEDRDGASGAGESEGGRQARAARADDGDVHPGGNRRRRQGCRLDAVPPVGRCLAEPAILPAVALCAVHR